MEENSSIGLQMLLPRRENPIIPVTYFPFDFFWVARIQLCIQYRGPEKKSSLEKRCAVFLLQETVKNSVKKLLKM